ncbi:hypothetical protein DFH08DRAFT_876527 [Mycena albidolilacea]|uniref:Uncharacterized protein n=1 Tax=Mycena albidolilacea TaxID=1033008 RepID=A0AAD7EMZ1_9AGAR|nr:hypothetical protein DFH08DRAFT_876527 [Mycena albidolilacea]
MHLPFLSCVYAPLLRIHLQSASPRKGMKKWEKNSRQLDCRSSSPRYITAEIFVFRLLLKHEPPCPHARSMDGYTLRAQTGVSCVYLLADWTRKSRLEVQDRRDCSKGRSWRGGARTKYSRTWVWNLFRLGEQRVAWVGDVRMALNSAELEGSASV